MFTFNLRSILLLAVISMTSYSWGQAYVSDAGRFSNQDMTGTARIQGLAGAQYSLGGDMSTLAGNPAGLGVYRKSEFGISSALQFGRTQNTYTTPSDVTQNISNRNNFHIPNFTFVVNNSVPAASTQPWKGGSWAVGFTRTNSFQNRIKFSGNNDVNSLRHGLADMSTGIDVGEYEDNLYFAGFEQSGDTYYGTLGGNSLISDIMAQGYWTELFYEDNGDYLAQDIDVPVFQEGEILTKGSQSQWDIAYGANYMDKLYLGGSIGIASLRYIQETTYMETSTETTSEINSYTHTQTLEQRGTGAFLKFGLIYRLTDYVRVASAFQTPTWYVFNEEQYTNLQVAWNNPSPRLGYNNFDYEVTYEAPNSETSFRAPMRWTNGISTFFGKRGFVSADFEYVPYRQARFNAFDYGFEEENAGIKDLYRNVWNIRIGAELRFDNVFIRGGYAHYPDPTNNAGGVDRGKTYITGGLGIKWENQHLDFALINESYNSLYSHYQMNDGSEPTTVSKTTNIKGVLTWGIYLY